MNCRIFLVVFLACFAAARETDHCYADKTDPYLLMGTKTSYHGVNANKDGFQSIPHCKPIQLWAMIRHGTRYTSIYPTMKLLTLPKLRDQIINNHEELGLGHLCNADLDLLRNWSSNLSMALENPRQLAKQGEMELEQLAKRLQKNFPELLQPTTANITEANYKFRATKTLLTKASMESFMKGLFDSKNAVPVQQTPDNDALLMAFAICKKWQTEVKDNQKTEEEAIKFRTGQEFQNLLQSVSRRLGFKHNITYDSIAIMYDMCRYQKAWEIDKVSPWCVAFSDSDIPILEYHEDLNLYYKTGHGHSLNAQIGCPPMQDMFQHFKKLESGNYSGSPQGIFYFTNTKTFQPFMAAMGIAKDSTPLLSTNYQSMRNRKWRSSKIASFANNIVAVFYKCETGDPNRIMLYQAEQPLLYEGCERGLCDWEYLKNKLGDAAFGCSLDFCELNSEASSITLISIEVLAAILAQVFLRSGHF